MSLFERLAAALSLAAPAELLPGDLHDAGTADAVREAAVLVAITDRPDPGLILTQRRADLRLHGGQVAFPGGRIDSGESAREAALREAWEEVDLDPAHVRIVAEADHYRTITGFGVTPIVAVIPPDLDLTPNPAEVESLFEAPLAHVLDPANHRQATVHFQGRDRSYIEIDWQGRRIWGATAAMIVNLSRRLRWN
jgi:8-oxo-dGTP pyrophosphatase MutT (NUDIX family)